MERAAPTCRHNRQLYSVEADLVLAEDFHRSDSDSSVLQHHYQHRVNTVHLGPERYQCKTEI